MDTFCVFVYMLMRGVSLKQRIPCIIRISIFAAFSAGKKCALYTGKYGTITVSTLISHNTLLFKLKIQICCGLNSVLVQNFKTWFNFYFLLSCIHYHNLEQWHKKIETSSKNIKPRINLNHNRYRGNGTKLWAVQSSHK